MSSLLDFVVTAGLLAIISLVCMKESSMLAKQIASGGDVLGKVFRTFSSDTCSTLSVQDNEQIITCPHQLSVYSTLHSTRP